MSQVTPSRTLVREWDFLEPAMRPNTARTKHVKIAAAGAGLTVSYPAGQVIAQKDDGTNEWAKIATVGYTGPKHIVKYPFTIDENGNWQYGDEVNSAVESHSNTIEVYYDGYFKTQDLTGLADDATMTTVGDLVSGTRTSGILHLVPRLP